MTLKQHLLINLTLLLSVLFFAQCKNRCSDGYLSVDRDCVCPEGKFEAYGKCRELEANEYYATLDDCPCNDTLYFKILDYGTSNVHYTNNNKASGTHEGWLSYFPLPSGDSIAGPFGDQICVIKGINCLPYWTGKFDNNGHINMTVLYFDMRDFPFDKPAVDTCRFSFRK